MRTILSPSINGNRAIAFLISTLSYALIMCSVSVSSVVDSVLTVHSFEMNFVPD